MKKTPWKRRVFFFTFCFVLLGFSLSSMAQQVVELYNPAGVREDGIHVDKLLKKTMTELGKTRPPLAGNFPEVRIEKVRIAQDLFGEVNELFYRRGWTDALPIVPPTVERVKETLRGQTSLVITWWPP